MKIMDINDQDECCTDTVMPVKKKKMKQAQLPFQMQSPVQSPNAIQSKKRKLISPSVECMSSKPVKILKKSLKKDVNNKPSDNNKETEDESVCIEIMNVEIENVKENTTLNKVEPEIKSETPKQIFKGQKKLEKLNKLKPSSLKMFFQKTDKQEESSKEDCQKSSEKETDKSVEKSSDTKVSLSTSDISYKIEDSPPSANNSLYQTDSDDAMISSDNEQEDRDDQIKTASEDGNKDEQTETTSTKEENKTPIIPKTDHSKQRRLTPKQQEKKLLSAKKREERQKLKVEKEKKLEEERENRRKEKEEKRREKEQKQMEKKMKEQKKQMEMEQKQKEKHAKEEERKKKEEAKEEEKKKREEEKLEAERKKQKAASNFTSFFVAKKQEKSKKIVPCKSSKTWRFEAKDEVIILDDENDGSSNIVNQDIPIEKQRPKLLQFCENQRPPYWGTWRKRSGNIHPRRPFSKDPEWFNYEVDSDDEWEEEEPGESLHGSDDEKDQENPDDNEYDVDNEFMVPHGYLSDEEVRADEEDKEAMSPETQKFKLKVLGEQFECERNTKTSKLKPKIIGCIWRGSENQFSSNVPQKTVDFLTAHEAWVRQIPVILPTNIDTTKSENDAMTASEISMPANQKTPNSKKRPVPEAALPDLIRFVHGNIRGRKFLSKEFMAYWSDKGDGQLYKGSLLRKIREIATWSHCPEEGPMHKKKCWYVSEEIRKQYLKEDLPLPNRWPNFTPQKESNLVEIADKVEKEDKDKEKKSVPLITQFTKKITQEEMKKQLIVKPASQNKATASKPLKRATLISVGRGEQFSKSSKETLLKSFVSSKKVESTNSSKENESENDDCVMIVECSENALVDDQKEVKSDDKKKSEDRLGNSPGECEEEEEGEKKLSNNVKKSKDDTTLKCDASTKDNVSTKRGKGTIDSPMEVDDED
ncbi:Chromatin assembly factor 1 subunit A [Habropoda laboriosa]|uniref:Chromatin assembly factor 1 subunit A n=1 Tax=Habropoda laboriosa TaxID=597456 RepID=A0A0L7R5Z1_9HYME|nr:Chromatin assembly factor 1 subunit A [Habropoda laboriosa]